MLKKLVVAVCIASGLHCYGAEFSDIRFQVFVDPEVFASSQHDASGKRESELPAAFTYIGFKPEYRFVDIRDKVPKSWLTKVTALKPPVRHKLEIRKDNYFPAAILMRAGDYVVDPEYGTVTGIRAWNGIRFHVQRNVTPNTNLPEYRFALPEPSFVKVTHALKRNRLSYLFITRHACSGLTDKHGKLVIKDLPCHTQLPLSIKFPWAERSAISVESSTLQFDEKHGFHVTLTPDTVTEHVIRIVPARRERP